MARYRPLIVVLLFGLLAVMAAGPLPAADEPPTPAQQAEKVWNLAMDHLAKGKPERAAGLFLRVYNDYPQLAIAEDALWRAIDIYRIAALEGDGRQWQVVRDLYQRYLTDYADSPRVPQVYYRLAQMLYGEGRYRQALARCRLLVKRFPDFPEGNRVRYLEAMCLLQTNNLEAAASRFTAFSRSHDPLDQARGQAGLGAVALARGRNAEALAALRRAFKLAPTFYRASPEVEAVRDLGRALLATGDEDGGRRWLMQYLNLRPDAPDQAALFLDLAESYHRQGEERAAQALYQRILASGDTTSRPALVAAFRRAQFLDDPHSPRTKWEEAGDLEDPAQDLPYLRLLQSGVKGKMALEVRRGLFRRLAARDDFAGALDVARAFLRQLPPEKVDPADREGADAMFLYVLQHYLTAGDHRAAYDFYREFHEHADNAGTGRVLYLVGQALEELALYRQAAVIYYRALAKPLEPQVKTDLYFRRARVYLALRDLDAADRLLTYLTTLYPEPPEAGRVAYYQGRLAQLRGDVDAGVRFYRTAQEHDPGQDLRAEYGSRYLEALEAAKDGGGMAAVLERYRAAGWLPPAAWQEWAYRAGRLLAGDDPRQAVTVLTAALAPELPQDSATAQKAAYLLGEVQEGLGEKEAARAAFQRAAKGPEDTVAKLAAARLTEEELEAAVRGVEAPPSGR